MGTSISVPICCPDVLAEGCTNDGRRWVSIRAADGTVSLVDPTDGSAVTVAQALDFCAPGGSTSHLNTVPVSGSQTILPANLEAWGVRAIGSGVTVNVNGSGAQPLQDNEVIESASQDDDLLSDTVVIATDATSTARVVWITRN